MMEEMKALVRQKDICVLATVSQNKPHCSLMAYTTDDECREIYMVTNKLTKKYRNLTENPLVSLLIDTRDEDTGSARLKAKALTVEGAFEGIEDEARKDIIRNRLLERHPHLGTLALHPDAEVFSIKVLSFLLLRGPTDSHFEQMV
jgi:nitroimidazol reductase NimA-like FMN-containing flavoprotein (pyridoxamine 5'-phosphate oxidase superfamily)